MSKDLALPGPEVPVIDESRLLEEFGGDEEILNELKELFIEHVPPLFEEIEKAVQAGDGEEMATHVHSLKGACATYGAARLASVCKSMELLAREGDMESVQANLDKLRQEYNQAFDQIRGVAAGV